MPNRSTMRVAIIAIVAITAWRMVAARIPVLGRFT